MPDDTQHIVARRLMSATITDTQFLKGLKHIFRADLAGTAWSWIAEQCFDYLDKYGAAPGRDIETIWASKPMGSEVRELLESVLSGLSDDYQNDPEAASASTDYLLQEAADYFTRELVLTEVLRAEEAAREGNVSEATDILANFSPPKILSAEMIDPAENPELIRKAFQEQPESLVSLGGALQEMVGSQITKDSFVAFLGKEKVGKTWMLQAIAFAAVRAGNKVAFFQAGDLSEGQQLIRLGIQIAGRSNKDQYCKSLLLPIYDCRKNQNGSCKRPERTNTISCVLDDEAKPYPELYSFKHDDVADYSPCSCCPEVWPDSWWKETGPCKPLAWIEACESWRIWRRAAGDKFRIGFWPTRTLTVAAIDRALQQLKDQQGWTPDVVIVDYFDILASEFKGEFRHQENARWEAGRRLSQEWGCSLVTVTQATRESYDRRLLKLKFTSEDKRKHAHLTAYYGLNKDEHDKAKGWMRINSLLVREDDFSSSSQIVVLQLIQRGRPNAGSFWFGCRNYGN